MFCLDTHHPTYWSPAPSYLIYQFITPGMRQFALMQMEAIGGQEVMPQAT